MKAHNFLQKAILVIGVAFFLMEFINKRLTFIFLPD
jgi:hypothetical protein